MVKEADTVRRIIGLAGQYAAVDENLTGRENIRMVGRLSHMSWKASGVRATELLEDFGLSDAGDRVLKTYSGGMRRRLDLAAALVARPPVLFLDEPTTGLDPQSRQDLWGVIENLVAGGTTVLLTTQYLEEADRLARNIVVVDHGRVIAEGSPAELKANLGTSVVSITLSDHETVPAGDRTGRLPLRQGAAHRPQHRGADRRERPPGGGRGVAHARRGGGAHCRTGAARAEPRRRLPEPHRAQVRGRDRGEAAARSKKARGARQRDADSDADGRDAA